MAEGDAKTARADTKFGQGFLTDIWNFVCLSRDLRPGKIARYELHGEPVMLGRSNAGKLFALP
jgi:phenylpropionate dioxygenase-like ring-hydroxylating dioxygenase large terminal subunit